MHTRLHESFCWSRSIARLRLLNGTRTILGIEAEWLALYLRDIPLSSIVILDSIKIHTGAQIRNEKSF